VTITGTDGADTLTGNDLANVINGKAGADTIAGGKGDDTIAGGTGADSFRFAPGAGHDKVTDFAANGDADLIDISAYLKAGQKATLTNVGNDVSIGFANGDTILLTNIQSESLVATTTGYKMGLRFFSEAGGEQTNHAAPIGTHSYDKIGAAGDKDWFKLDLTKGADMRVAVEAAGSGMGTLEDAKVSIYDSTGKLIISDNDSGSAGDAFARFKAPTTGSYYVVVESAKAGGTGSYVLDVATSNMVFDTGTHQLNGSTGADILIGGAFNDSLPQPVRLRNGRRSPPATAAGVWLLPLVAAEPRRAACPDRSACRGLEPSKPSPKVRKTNETGLRGASKAGGPYVRPQRVSRKTDGRNGLILFAKTALAHYVARIPAGRAASWRESANSAALSPTPPRSSRLPPG